VCMKTYFLDTNIFLQCYPLNQLSWDKIANGEELLLLVPRAVQTEIDRLKHDGNSRRAKRAKEATSLFRQILVSENKKFIIKSGAPNVVISFPPIEKIDGLYPGILDISRGDDYIIAEAIAYRSNHKENNVTLITGDTGLLQTADSCGLPYLIVPEDWLLLPETDDKDKKIAAQEKIIKELQSTYPVIDINVSSDGDESISSILITVKQYTPLSKDELSGIIDKIKLQHPISTNYLQTSQLMPAKYYDVGFVRQFSAPTDEEIRKYKAEDYPAWLNKVNGLFSNLHKNLEGPTRYSNINVSVFNNGTVPAENVKIEIRSLGDIVLVGEQKEGAKNISFKLPQPPSAPMGQLRNGPLLGAMQQAALALQRQNESYTGGLQFPRPQPSHDRHKFYWKPGKPYINSVLWSLECDEFRHKDEGLNLDVTLFVPSGIAIDKGALECRVIGKNIQNPKIATIPVIIEYKQYDTMEEVQKLLA